MDVPRIFWIPAALRPVVSTSLLRGGKGKGLSEGKRLLSQPRGLHVDDVSALGGLRRPTASLEPA